MRRKSFVAFVILVTAVNLVNCNFVNLNKTQIHHENLTSQLSMACDDGDGKCKEIHRDHMVLVHKFDEYFHENNTEANHHEFNERLKYSSVIYGLLMTANENQLNRKCYNEIMQIFSGISKREVWAMKSECCRCCAKIS